MINNVEKMLFRIWKKITLIELLDGDEETYTIVGSAHAKPALKVKFSNDSPIAKGIVAKLNEEVVIPPGGEMKIRIIDIQSA